MLKEAGMFLRFSTGLRRFLRSPLSPAACRRIVEDSLRLREETFLRLAQRAIYDFPGSPYRKLLLWAGVAYGDLERMVKADGVDAVLERLYDAGVSITLEQFKGRQRIERPGLSIDVAAEDFDNPLLARDFEVASGGSTGARRRMKIDFDLLVHDTACRYFGFLAQGVESHPLAVWRGVLPDSSGLKHALINAKLGQPMERWFSPTQVSWGPNAWQFALLTNVAVQGGRLWGNRIPKPEHVPLNDGRPVAQWLQEKVRQGRPGLLSAAANNAVRVCIAAKEGDIDIAGTVFRVSGEPYTDAKRKLVEELGARTFSGWSMSEAGPLGTGCANREALDEVHLFRGKVATLQRRKMLADGETEIDALFLTTLLTSTPKIMLNLDTGDYGVLSKRKCGCPLEQIGFEDHLHTIRNYEKLTAGGIQFLGSEIIRLVEEVLPAAFGGHATDYQFVEHAEGAVSQVAVVVSPRIGAVDDAQVVRTVLGSLAKRDSGHKLMAGFWEQGRTLRVERREPYVTAAAKTPPLRVIRK
jgi:hypothetical protein